MPEPIGPNCAAGGVLVRAGLDDGADANFHNGVLDSGEEDVSFFVCEPEASGRRA